jgi:hypothetical protein
MKRECESYPDHRKGSHPNAGSVRCECGRWLVQAGYDNIGMYYICPKERELAQLFMLM